MHALTHLTEDEILFRNEIAKFADRAILPKREMMDRNACLDSELIRECFELGLMGIEIPEESSGSGSSFFLSCLAIEEISKVDASVGVFVDVQNTLVNNVFLNWSSQKQKNVWLPKLAENTIGAFCLTEADSGSDAFALKTQAEDKGDHWLLNGKKIFITNAKEASVFIVFATINTEAGYKGITAFIVEKSTPGFSLGKSEDKLGIRASSTCEVIFEDLKIPKENVIGEPGKGYKIAIETLNEGRIGIASQMLGLAQGAFLGAFRYAGERSQFGKPLNQFQGIQFDLARMAADIEAARLLVYNAARLKDSGLPFAKEAAIAKFSSSRIAEEVASLSLEIYGGYGFIKEFPAEKFYRDVKIGKLYEGTSNLQLQTIFKSLTKEHL
ncbi:MAG: acyl-CoA dehydrogenase family protein [Deltaproteobacteria bacterium]|nr:acyl-CoA dehydrogenase family protein [Deltaproteobacteria bacterium]